MRKIFLCCIVFIAFASCQRDDVTTNKSTNDYSKPCSKTYVRPIAEALDDLNQTLEAIYTETRANDRKSYSINSVRTYISNASTRSNTSVEIPDTLVYIVDFDNEGYAILGAQSNISPIFSITEQGAFDIDKFTKALNYEIENNILTAEEYERRVAEEEDAEDIDIYSTNEDFVYGLVASSVVGSLIDGPIIIDPTPVTPPIPTPNPPRVIGRDTTKYVELLDYYPEMLTTHWHQRDPFNNLCKVVNDTICPAGCVVIAIAQIMAYNEFPSNKTFNGVVVDWDLVKRYGSLESAEEIATAEKQLSNLCYELGKDDKCDVVYAPDGSSSNIRKAKKTLDLYGYKNLDIRRGYADNDKEAMISFIKSGKPLYIRAETASGNGHAWVLDGYLRRRKVTKVNEYLSDGTYTTEYNYESAQRLVHCNFGWGGLHDGYYSLLETFYTPHRYTDLEDPNFSYNADEDEDVYHYSKAIKTLMYNI